MMMQRILRLAVLSAAGMLPQSGFADEAKPAQKNPQDLFQELDKNKDGKLTADEVSDEQRKFFDHLRRVADADKNGELTKDEFIKGFKPDESPQINPQAFGGRGEGPQFDPKQQFERLDTNKDGKLTLEELPEQAKERLKPLFDRLGKTELSRDDFVKATERSRQGFGGDGNPGELFKRLDANNDGKLTLAELPEPAQERFKPLFERLGKKELTQEEFAQAGPRFGGNPGEMFKRLDANNDGKLTIDELPEQAKERLKPLFERLGKKELTQEDFAQIGGRFRGPGGGEGNPAETFKKLDANNDGKLTRDELPESARPQFDKLLERAGKGQDGALSHDEFVKFGGQDRGEAQARKPEGAPDGEKRPPREGGRREEGRPDGLPSPEDLFKRWDTNNDGKVTLDEVPDRGRPLVERILERAGKGRDGALTLDDIKKFPPAPPPGGPDGPRRPDGGPRGEGPGGGGLFRKIDANGDGRLSKDELSKASEHFDELDLNKDGQLDPREIFGQGPGGPRRPEAGREGPPRDGTRGDNPPRDGKRRDEKGADEKGRDESDRRREKTPENRDKGSKEDKPREEK